MKNQKEVKIKIEKNQVISFKGFAHTDIECLAGNIWITSENQPGDVLLETGMQAHLDGKGVIVVEGMIPSDIILKMAS